MSPICLVISGLMLLIGIAVLILGIFWARQAASLSKVAMEAIDNLQPGRRVKVRGQIYPIDVLVAPNSKEKCVFYAVATEARHREADTPILDLLAGPEKIEQTPFYLSDGGKSQVLVDPTDGEFSTTFQRFEHHADSPFVTAEKIAVETYLKVSEWVYVVGNVALNEDHRFPQARLVLKAGTKEPLFISLEPPGKAKKWYGLDVLICFAIAAVLLVIGGIFFILQFV